MEVYSWKCYIQGSIESIILQQFYVLVDKIDPIFPIPSLFIGDPFLREREGILLGSKAGNIPGKSAPGIVAIGFLGCRPGLTYGRKYYPLADIVLFSFKGIKPAYIWLDTGTSLERNPAFKWLVDTRG